MITVETRPATANQLRAIAGMATDRPTWNDILNGQAYETVFDVLGNDGNPDPKFVSFAEACDAITALYGVPRRRKFPVPSDGRAFAALQDVLLKLQEGKYALPRKADGVLDFFEIVQRPNGLRYLNRLLGSPGDWNREKLPVNLQAAAARAISGDWVACARAYADHFQSCARCDAPLSNPRSRAAKIGHDCAKIWGWAW